jgi:hypothetical protein
MCHHHLPVSTCVRYCFTNGVWLCQAHQEAVSAPTLLQDLLVAQEAGELLGQGQNRLSQAPDHRRRPSTRRMRRGGGGGRSDSRVRHRATTSQGTGRVSEGRREVTSAAVAVAVAFHRARLRIARATVAGEEAASAASLALLQVAEVSPRARPWEVAEVTRRARLQEVAVARVDSRRRRVTTATIMAGKGGTVGDTWDRLPDTHVTRRGVITQVRLRVAAWARLMM